MSHAFPVTLVPVPELIKLPSADARLLSTMSNSSPKRIGGEYGAIRANIDIGKLNAYLAAYVPAISSPVDVQQFKVCSQLSRVDLDLISCPVWTGMA